MWNFGNKFFRNNLHYPLIRIVRYKRNKRLIKVPEVTKSLEERLSEINTVDHTLEFKVDIGLPPQQYDYKQFSIDKRKDLKKISNNTELEKKSRQLALNCNLEDIRTEWLKAEAPHHIQAVANHYNVYNDLFGDAYFTPYIMMNIYYPQENKSLEAHVYRGNVIKPTEAFSRPVVEFQSQPYELWCLTLVSPDGHLTENNMEYIHWFVGNIPGGNIEKGETIWDYLPPFPARGLGYQRFIFVLYKQEKKIDFSVFKNCPSSFELNERSFNTFKFYEEMQENITPAGLSFFQSDWDKTSRKVFHEILNMEEPIFEYDFDPQPFKKQEWYPIRRAFDLYLDKYKDPKELAEEYLFKKLKDFEPLQRPKKAFPYPKAINCCYRKLPSWLRTKEMRYRTGLGRVQNEQRDEYE